MTERSPNRQKTMWEKEKLDVTSTFSISHSVFKRIVLQTHKNQGLYGKRLKVLPMNGEKYKTQQPIDLHRKSFFVGVKKNHSEIENLSICWLLEISSPTETVDGTTEKQSHEMEKDYI